MKLRLLLLLVLIGPLFAQTTPNLHLNIPPFNTTGWNNLMNANSVTLDTFLGGMGAGVAKGSELQSSGIGLGPVYSTKQLHVIRDYGCVGNGVADDTTCVNNWLASASATGGLYCKAGVYLLPNGITYTGTNTQGLYLLGEAGSSLGGGQGCVFKGGAGTSAGAVLKLIGLNGTTINNIAVMGANGASKYALWFDATNDTGGVPSANVHLIDITVGEVGGAGSCAIALGHANSPTPEVASYIFDNVTMVGYSTPGTSVNGVCALVGGNTKNFQFYGGSAVGFQYGYYFPSGGGSLAFVGQGNASNTVVDYLLTSGSASIISADSEGSNSFVKGTTFGTLTLMNNQIEETNTDATDVMVSWAGMLDIRNNSCRNNRTGATLCKIVSPNPLNSATTTAASSVLSENNCYANSTSLAPLYDGSANPMTPTDPSSYAGSHQFAVDSHRDRGGDCLATFGPTLQDVHQGGGGWRFDDAIFTEQAAPANASGQDVLWGDSTAHRIKMNNNNGGSVSVGTVVASGTSTMTGAAITGATCQTAITTTATGALTTDTISWSYATAPTLATDALLHISPYVTSGNVNFTRCNPTAGSITGTAIVVNWAVVR